MSAIASSCIFLLSGICMYAAVTHLDAGARRPRNRARLLFAAMCVFIALHGISNGVGYQATTAEEAVLTIKWGISMAALFFGLLPWFVAELTGVRPKSLLIGHSVLLVAIAIANIALPYSLQYDALPHLETLRLPWGETVSLTVGLPHPWFPAALALVYLAYAFALYALVVRYRRGGQRETLLMLAAVGLSLLAATQGILVRLDVVHFLHLGAFGQLGMVIVMNLALNQEFRTRQKQTEASLRSSEARYRRLFEQANDAILVLEAGRFTDCNLKALELFACRREDILGNMPEAFSRSTQPDGRDSSEVAKEKIDAAHAGTSQRFEWLAARADGTPFPAEVSLVAMELENRPSLLAIVRDVSERKRMEDAIRRMAYQDDQTGLANRAQFSERLTDHLAQARHASRFGAMLLIDLDHFKTINDALSHEVGDEVLRAVARRLTETGGARSLLARLGGDEFAVLIAPIHASRDQATHQARNDAEQILLAMSKPLVLGENVLTVGASIGIVLFPGWHDESALDILRQAEIALYHAKRTGRGNIQFFLPALQAMAETRLQLEEGLRRAIPNQELALHFQPLVDSVGRMIGAEALLRWTHPERGVVSPDEFVPVAEESGLIHSIGAWVLEQSCARLAAWLRDGVAFSGHLSINVSPWQFAREDYVQQLVDTLQKFAVPPGRLMLELTETALLYNLEDAIEKLRALRALGLGVALDDFGTGYSSLSYLKSLPLDVLKIDQTFVQALNGDTDHSLIETMIAIGRHMRLEVIAEGVETTMQHATLLDLGCENFQGYLFAKPLSESGFLKWIAANQSDQV